MRAIHLAVDDKPPIVQDTFALALAGHHDIEAVVRNYDRVADHFAQSMPKQTAVGLVRGLRAVTVLRARIAEDLLDTAVAHGVTQCVILGAGLDSLAYRKRAALPGCSFFEVDRGAMQAWKQRRLAQLGVGTERVHFVPADLEHDMVLDLLTAAGFRLNAPACVLWLGVTPYVPPKDVVKMLAQVRAFARGTLVLFDFIVPEALLDDVGRTTVRTLRQNMASHGEAGATDFHPDVLIHTLRTLGFSSVELLSEETLNARYCAGRTDGFALPVPCSARWIVAQV